MLKFNREIKLGNHMVGSDYPTYFIAEIGGNFDGDIDKAKRLIDAAKKLGLIVRSFRHLRQKPLFQKAVFPR